jgi:hypothetical protein
VPPSLAGLENRPERYEQMGTSYEPFRDWLLQEF